MSNQPGDGVEAAQPSLSHLLQLTTAYWASMVVLAANKLGVFAVLSGSPRSADEVAGACGASARAMEMLLNALVAQGLVRKQDGRYGATEVTEAFLTPGQPGYLGDGLNYSLDLYPIWGHLPTAVQKGAPPESPSLILGEDPERTRNFVLAMHNRALGVASSLARILDLSPRRSLLDVGGGPGTYSILLAQKTPGLRATVLDLPGVLEISKGIIEEFGMSERVGVLAGDYKTSAFPAGSDVVLMSGMMHREPAGDCRELLKKAFACLEAGGQIVVSDVFFDDEEKTSPPFTTLFALNMMLTSEQGSAHARTEMARWMEKAGFTELQARPFPPPMPHTMLTGIKPRP